MNSFDSIAQVYANILKANGIKGGCENVVVDMFNKEHGIKEISAMSEEEKSNTCLATITVQYCGAYSSWSFIGWGGVYKEDENGEPKLDEYGNAIAVDPFEYEAIRDAVRLIFARLLEYSICHPEALIEPSNSWNLKRV